jgi:hypothetical protein
LPWAGYFLKMAACDVFVFHDNVQITKAGPTRRVKISARHNADQTQWITVPLKKHSDFALIKDLEVSWDNDWSKKHLNQITNAYSQCEQFGSIFPWICNLYEACRDYSLLSEMNIFIIQQIMNLLGIKAEIFRSSHLPLSGKSSEYNLAIVKYLQGTHYLCGIGSNHYQDNILFTESGILLDSMDYLSTLKNNISLQYTNPTLSIIEFLMKYDVDGVKKVVHHSFA